MRNEECWILIGKVGEFFWYGRRCFMTTGEPATVEFDFDYVLEREEKKGDVIGFLHTHPNMPASPSKTDDDTMRAWVNCFGKPLVCGIYGIDGLRGHFYIDDESDPIECEQMKRLPSRFIVGNTPDEVYFKRRIYWKETESNSIIEYLKVHGCWHTPEFRNTYEGMPFTEAAYSSWSNRLFNEENSIDVGETFPTYLCPYKCGDFEFYIRLMIGQGSTMDVFSRAYFAKNWPEEEEKLKKGVRYEPK